MKITALIWMVVCMQVSAVPVDAQVVSLEERDSELTGVFLEIRKQTGYNFLYNNRLLKRAKPVTVSVRDMPLEEALKKVFKGQPLTYFIIEQTIIVEALRGGAPVSIADPDIGNVQIEVRGQLRDTAGLPLPGGSVVVKGTRQGTTTALDGSFRLTAAPGDILVFSLIGYQTREIPLEGRTVLNVTLEEDLEALEEVVIVGYGTQKKRDVIGSIATITSEDLTRQPAASIDAALQGQAAGLQVMSSSGNPGAPVRILIRGTNSISTGVDPLYIVDGMPIYSGLNGLERTESTTPQSPLSTINPNDIASIQILKDAAATAIYGSRGSNGVVLITTKSGKKGGGLQLGYNTGLSNLPKTMEDMGYASTEEWFAIMDKARENSGRPLYEPSLNLNAFPDFPLAMLTREEAMSIETDWFDQIMRTGRYHDLNISTQNATERMNYFVSANYRGDKSVLKQNRFQRFSVRANTDLRPVNNLTAGVRFNFAYTDNDRVKTESGGGLTSSSLVNGGFARLNMGALPWYPVYNPDHESGYWNPLSNNLTASIDPDLISDEVKQYRMLMNFYADYALPWVDGLSLRSELSGEFIQNNSVFWQSEFLRDRGSYATDQAVTYQSINYNIFATYTKSFSDFNLNLVAGTESQRTKNYRRFLEGELLQTNYQQLGTPNTFMDMFSGAGGERYIRSFFGRGNLKFRERYLVGVSFRRDGSSVFTKENRWSDFSALSAGWIISDEPFFNNNIVSLLKLRGSFGQTGNQNINSTASVTTWTSGLTYGSEAALNGGSRVTNIGASDLKWETTNSFDFGLDFGLLKDRINGSFAYYNQNIEDMLLRVPLPPSASLNNIWANAGEMVNRGFEFSISSTNINTDNFSWSTDLNVTTNRNEIKKLTRDVDESGAGIISGKTITKTGGRIGAFYMAEYAGIDPEKGVEMIYEIDQDILAETGETVKTGRLIPATLYNLSNNRIIHKDKTGLPAFFGGLTNHFRYRNFDLNVFFSFMGGYYIYDVIARRTSYPGGGWYLVKEDLLENSWEPGKTDARYPQLIWDQTFPWDWDPETGEWVEGSGNYQNASEYHDKELRKADFVKLKNVQLGYTFPPAVAQKLGMRSIRLFVTGTNLLTFTGYEGWDPEVIVTTSGNLNLNPGYIENPPLPHVRTFSIGANIQF